MIKLSGGFRRPIRLIGVSPMGYHWYCPLFATFGDSRFLVRGSVLGRNVTSSDRATTTC